MNASPSGPLRVGMIGGGPDAFIGAVHRMAMAMDGKARLVAGAFSSKADRSRSMGQELGLPSHRVHGDWQDLLQQEASLPEAERMEAVCIVTPNHLHFDLAMAALQAGFAVICDKPLAVSVEQAEAIAAEAEQRALPFLLTHNYTGYPAIQQARAWVEAGRLGSLRKVHVEYFQGWLSEAIEEEGQKQAAWRTDPSQAGPGGALGDIGSHGFQLLEYVSGLRTSRLMGVKRSFLSGRTLDDDAMVLLDFAEGASGSLMVSQVCAGANNGLRLRLFGEHGGLEWEQERPERLRFLHKDGTREEWLRATGEASPAAEACTRLPSGHPEGFVGAFANLYCCFAAQIRGQASPIELPGPADGLRSLQFIEAVLRSSAEQGWVELP